MTLRYSSIFLLILMSALFVGCRENDQGNDLEKRSLEPIPRQVVLTWQQNTSTTMTITWRTDEEIQGPILRYSEDPGANANRWEKQQSTTFTFEETAAWLHTAELTGLKPATEYFVVIEHPVSSEGFSFRTMPDKDHQREIMFLAGADSRSNRDARREMNKLAAAQEPDFIIFTGDFNSGPVNDLVWDEWFDDWHELLITSEGRRIPIVPTLGNHEVVGGFLQNREAAPFFYQRFITPEPRNYYALTFGPELLLVTLDSDHTMEVRLQTTWLDSILAAHDHKTWKIIQYHVTAWPSVRSFNEETPVKIRENWVPVFEKYNVNLVLEAHDHAFKKTVPIRDNKRDDEKGIVYIGDGGWGAPLRATKNPEEHWWLDEAFPADHFWQITLSADGTSFSVVPVFRPLAKGFILETHPL